MHMHRHRLADRPDRTAVRSCLSRPGSAGRFARGMRGFTLPELLTTLAVMVVLTVMAAAAMGPTISGNRAYTAQSELATSLALARSEAGRRGVAVGVNATAPVSGNEFGGGWFVWVDENNNGTFDAGEAVVRTHEALPSSAVTIASNATGILFNAMGFTVPAGTADVTVCPVAGARTGYAISVQPSGLTDVNPSAPC
jgi:type IV fimbrial biogenesis protein FimT